jgi:hypothetical protein
VSDTLDSIRARAERSIDMLDDWSPGLDFPEGVLPASPDQVLRLLAVAKAASRHTEDCCRTDIHWREQMASHNALCAALAALEEKA